MTVEIPLLGSSRPAAAPRGAQFPFSYCSGEWFEETCIRVPSIRYLNPLSATGPL